MPWLFLFAVSSYYLARIPEATFVRQSVGRFFPSFSYEQQAHSCARKYRHTRTHKCTCFTLSLTRFSIQRSLGDKGWRGVRRTGVVSTSRRVGGSGLGGYCAHDVLKQSSFYPLSFLPPPTSLLSSVPPNFLSVSYPPLFSSSA